MIALFRIDDRLLHGQVAIGWTTSVNANVILIVNDEVKNDKVKATALDLGKPSNVKLYIRGVEESGEIVEKFSGSQKSNVLVVVKNTQDALKLIQHAGGVIRSINVGGLRHAEGKKKLTDLVSVDENDIQNLKEIHNMGIEVEFRMLPRDKKHLLNDYIKEG